MNHILKPSCAPSLSLLIPKPAKSPHECSFLDWAKTIENKSVEPYHSLQERIKQL